MANLIRRNREGREIARDRSEGGWDPFRVMDALLRWDPLRGDLGGLSRGSAYAPEFDIKESKDAYVFKADLPGIQEKDIELALTGNMLKISGQREEERREDDEQFHANERSYGYFARTFTLPEGVDAEHTRAELRSGVLTVTVPKKPEVQPKRIAISTTGEAAAQPTVKS